MVRQVETTWDEDLYTTKLDRRNAGISVAAAARIAAEIEASSSTNHHLAEERGQEGDDQVCATFLLETAGVQGGGPLALKGSFSPRKVCTSIQVSLIAMGC